MKNSIVLILTLLAAVACTGNQSAQTTEPESSDSVVAFEVAHNYFFKNDQQIPADPKITTEEQFAQLFGMATFMGEQGRPTQIDFSKQFVLAVVLPVTDLATEITPNELVEKNDSLSYTYTVATGERQSFSTQPVSLIVLDKKYFEKPLQLNCLTDTLVTVQQ